MFMFIVPNTKDNETEGLPHHGSGDKHQVVPDSTHKSPTKGNDAPKPQKYRRAPRNRKRSMLPKEKRMPLVNNSVVTSTA